MKKAMMVACALAMLAWMAACSGEGGDGSSDSGTLAVSLSDAPGPYRAVYVTIDDVQVHLGGNESSPNKWQSVEMPQRPLTVNLLDLVNGVRQHLGLVDLPAGRYTQLRLIIGAQAQEDVNFLSVAHPFANYVVDQENPPNINELRIPSGRQTGIKIVHGFEIASGHPSELVLDFDALESVVEAGSSDNWLLKPTIRVAEVAESATISGYVTGDGTGTGIAGARVSVQVFDAGTALADQVTVVAATITGEDGSYQLLVAPGQYNIVVYAAGWKVAYNEIGLAPKGELKNDFELEAVEHVTVSGLVTIADGAKNSYARLSFREDVGDQPGTNVIEVQAVNVLSDTGYSIDLPENQEYTVIGSSFGHDPAIDNLELTTEDVALTISIPPPPQ